MGTWRCVFFFPHSSLLSSLSSSFPQTIDVIFPLHPILLYTNPTLLAVLLEPLLRYTHSGLYPNRWPVHDLGRYPNATGYNEGNDEPMPVEEAGNMLWCAFPSFFLPRSNTDFFVPTQDGSRLLPSDW
jgi:hypothetical protein